MRLRKFTESKDLSSEERESSYITHHFWHDHERPGVCIPGGGLLSSWLPLALRP